MIAWGSVAICVTVALCLIFETSSPLGVLMPSASTLIVAGAMASSNELDWILVVPIAVTAAVAGDVIGMHLGAVTARRPQRRPGRAEPLADAARMRRTRRITSTATALAHRHGAHSLALTRFVPGVRSIVPNIVGRSGVPASTVLRTAAPAAMLWVGVELAIGAVGAEVVAALAVC